MSANPAESVAAPAAANVAPSSAASAGAPASPAASSLTASSPAAATPALAPAAGATTPVVAPAPSTAATATPAASPEPMEAQRPSAGGGSSSGQQRKGRTGGKRRAKGAKGGGKKKKREKFSVADWDKHQLYEVAVQDPEVDIKFMTRVYKKEHNRLPMRLREDFCGTAKMCAEWVATNPERTAVGLDIDQPTLDWGLEHNIAPLTDAQKSRVDLRNRDVQLGTDDKPDIIAAFNFSYCTFKKRQQLLAYCKQCIADLGEGGVFMLDIHGGTEAHMELEEEDKKKGFTYVWEQKPYDAVGGLGLRYIHFKFPDRANMKRAFTYDWRIWSLPELTDILEEAGASRVEVYWEGADDNGEGNGIFRKVTKADNEESWIAYVMAWK